MSKETILDKYTIEYIKDCYTVNKTLQRTAFQLNVSLETLRKFFIKHNIQYCKRQKYTCNHHFFSKDNEASFYWAGFIAADGNVEKRSNRIKIELALVDIQHLHKFKTDVSTTAPITIHENKEDREQFSPADCGSPIRYKPASE